ncbi:8697_t:CDS:2, partial [Diversispora eburnea]
RASVKTLKTMYTNLLDLIPSELIPSITKNLPIQDLKNCCSLDNIWKTEVIREIRKRLIVDCTFIDSKTTVKALINPKSQYNSISKALAKKMDLYISRDWGSRYPAVEKLGVGTTNAGKKVMVRVIDKPEYDLVLGSTWLTRLGDRIDERDGKYWETNEEKRIYYARNNIDIVSPSLYTFYELLFPKFTTINSDGEVILIEFSDQNTSMIMLNIFPRFESSKSFTVLGCEHTYHRICIEKKLLLTKPNGCPFINCGKSVETITEASTAETEPRRDSEFSTSSLVGKMGNQLNIQSQEIIDEEMTDADNRGNKDNSGASAKAHNSKGKGTDMMEGSNKRPIEVDTEEMNTAQDKSSNKKAKTKKDESSILKKLIKDLTTNVFTRVNEKLETTNTDATTFLQLSNNIDLAEIKNEDATRNVITRYFDFGESLYKRYKELKPNNGKIKATAMVRVEIRKEIPESKLSNEALRKRKERAEKVYKLFMGTGDNIDQVIVGVLNVK